MQRRATRPEKISLEDIFWSISTERLTGDTAGYGQVVPLADPRHTELRLMWHAPIGPVTAPLLPVFMGQDEVPASYGPHRYLTFGESHRFLDRRKELGDKDSVSLVPQGAESAHSAVQSFKRLMHLVFQKPDPLFAEVSGHWRLVEKATNAAMEKAVTAAGELLDAGKHDLACHILAEFSCARLEEALHDCDALAEAAYVRLRAQGALNVTTQPLAMPQIW
jgi:hypothetical protein